MEGYFHSMSWLSLKPWELKSSCSCLFQSRQQTCEPVLTEFKHAPVLLFQNLMLWSPTPPPEASKLLWKGHQARAFTAEVCSSMRWRHWVAEFVEAIDMFQMWIRLSFPPLANSFPETDHFNPQTSWLCPSYTLMPWDLILKSLLMIKQSIPPVVKMLLFQSSDPTLNLWPFRVLTYSEEIKHVSRGNCKGIYMLCLYHKDS